MNSFATPKKQYQSATSQDRTFKGQRAEFVLYALCSGMTLLLAATVTVLSLSQVA